MEALYILVPLSVVLVFIAIWVFLRMSDGGQFDDMVGPAMRVVLDDDRAADDTRLADGAREASDVKKASDRQD
ncbi:cbb3-type cytochrome oxidase assembly protein CcoS [Noviherbaspirillum sp. UKPF54]|uniref:cbb3-type cytochrome oxidase assembly protein CcoS n=1 Tax=Noviherbaspirillum sp. UKPF54 TaxID=2601898 RepID=UPI0011B190D4|nr:cbb3-type cytochrome oxidase assembly protein CcoS [Noviherbaspirillum sp. UKPF54]QDZ27986.1 cbb3-type cytochrome oxidase assembly protein CcoS [Noviherbaspirillum sp. UKPF54]